MLQRSKIPLCFMRFPRLTPANPASPLKVLEIRGFSRKLYALTGLAGVNGIVLEERGRDKDEAQF